MSDHPHAHTAATDVAADEVVECPVMPGSTTLKSEAEADDLVRDHEGTRYYLCCGDCAQLWDADPARYANA